VGDRLAAGPDTTGEVGLEVVLGQPGDGGRARWLGGGGDAGGPPQTPGAEAGAADDAAADAGASAPPGRGRQRAAVGVVAVVGLLAAAAAVVGRGEEASTREAARESQREAARAATSTTVAPPTTARPRPTTTVLAPFAEVQLDDPLAPVATGGTVLYGLSVVGEVVRIDLDAGSIQARLLRGPSGEPPGAGFRVLAREGSAVLTNDDGDLLVVPDGEATRPRWRADVGKVFPAVQPGEIWRVTSDLSGDRWATRETLDGEPTGPALGMPPGAIAQGDDGAGAFLFDAYGRRFSVADPDSGAAEVASTPLLASSATTLVRMDCAAPGDCRWEASDRSAGTTIGTGKAPPELAGPGPPAVLSPDNRYLARVSGTDGDGALTVIDLQRGRGVILTGELQVDVAPVWTAAGNQLHFLDDRGELYRLDAPTGDFQAVCGTCFRPLVSLDAVGPAAPAPVPAPAAAPAAPSELAAPPGGGRPPQP
jgi:hypothetical protein